MRRAYNECSEAHVVPEAVCHQGDQLVGVGQQVVDPCVDLGRLPHREALLHDVARALVAGELKDVRGELLPHSVPAEQTTVKHMSQA